MRFFFIRCITLRSIHKEKNTILSKGSECTVALKNYDKLSQMLNINTCISVFLCIAHDILNVRWKAF